MTNTNDQFMNFGDFNAHHPTWNCGNTKTSGNSLFVQQQFGFKGGHVLFLDQMQYKRFHDR